MTELELHEKLTDILQMKLQELPLKPLGIIYKEAAEYLAVALIAEGIGDVSEYERLKTELRSKVDYIHELWDVKEDYKHRLRLTERALYRACGSSQMMLVFLQKPKRNCRRKGKMSKCMKGCLPECQYFTTGGCISPFNCAYKIEEHNQNTVFTNGDTNNLSGIEKFFINTVKSGVLPQEPMNYDGAAMKAYISYLESENAELRARLDKAVELNEPDIELNPYTGDWELRYQEVVTKVKVYDKRSEAESRLAELKGESNA